MIRWNSWLSVMIRHLVCCWIHLLVFSIGQTWKRIVTQFSSNLNYPLEVDLTLLRLLAFFSCSPIPILRSSTGWRTSGIELFRIVVACTPGTMRTTLNGFWNQVYSSPTIFLVAVHKEIFGRPFLFCTRSKPSTEQYVYTTLILSSVPYGTWICWESVMIFTLRSWAPSSWW